MRAQSPEDLHRLWVDGVNRGDLDGLVALYEPEAAFVAQPGQVVAGHAAVRDATAGLLALKPTATLEVRTSIVAGDLAPVISTWRVADVGSDGAAVHLEGQTSGVVRWKQDGAWRFVIDHPWGNAAVVGP